MESGDGEWRGRVGIPDERVQSIDLRMAPVSRRDVLQLSRGLYALVMGGHPLR